MKFLLRYPDQSVELFLSDGKVQDQQWNRFFEVRTHTLMMVDTEMWKIKCIDVPINAVS